MKLKVVFIVLLFCNLLSAQEGELLHAERHKYNPLYRANYFNKMIFKVDLNSDIDNFYVANLNSTENSQSSFIPNQRLKLRLSFDYKFLGVFLSTSPSFLPGNNRDSDKGKTKTLDLSFKFFYSDRLRQEIDFKKTKGFYLANPLKPSSVDIYPDLQINTIGGRTFYILNNNFSYRAFENMTERQLVSAGSLIPSLSYYFNNLITSEYNTGKKNLLQIHSFDSLLQLGYMYNFVLGKKWYATVGWHPGIGYNASKSFFNDKEKEADFEIKSTNFNFNFDFNISLGYNNKNLFSGVKFNYRDYEYNNQRTAELINSKAHFELFIGYRFKTVKSVEKVFESVEDVF
ncbi:DUF4421 family protein [Flavobacterium sp. K5-23]|nr:DUF4421 family protein [Flavobacterium sp. K5-23]